MNIRKRKLQKSVLFSMLLPSCIYVFGQNINTQEIDLPYNKYSKEYVTGDYYVIKGEKLEKYPSLDLRNALVALVPGLIITELDGSTGVSSEETRDLFRITKKVNATIRGFNPIYIIDNVEIDITEMQLDASEVESITVIKDVVGKAMYGPNGANGVISIKTKRGYEGKHHINVNIEGGVSAVDRFPDWANASEYAQINNLSRANNGLNPLYSDKTIETYKTSDAYDMLYPSVNFKDMMFKDTKSYQRVNVSSSGGNKTTKYYAYLGYSGEGDNFKLGSSADYNKINARANLDVAVNEYIDIEFNVFGGLTIRRSPNYDYDPDYGDDNSDDSEMDILEFNSAIEDATTIAPNAFPIHVNFDEETGLPWYGVSNTFKNNPIGNLVSNGYYTETGRTGATGIALNYDLKQILKGLKSKTYIGFNVHNLVRIGKAEQYSAYLINPSDGTEGYDLERVWGNTDMSGQAKLHDYYFQKFTGYQTFSYSKSFADKHQLNTSLTYHLSQYTRNGVENPLRQQNANWAGSYVFDNKYILQGAVTFAGTQSLIDDKQYQFYPSFGAGWVFSKEKFAENISFLDWGKLRTEFGQLGYQSLTPPLFLYEEKWLVNSSGTDFGPHPIDRWFGTNKDGTVYRSTYNKYGNPNLTWETRTEFSLGADLSMFKNRLNMNASYYHTTRSNQWVNASNQYPLMLGLLAVPKLNYNESKYYGGELSLGFNDRVNDFRYSISTVLTLPRSKRIKFDEPNYRSDYQFRTGQPEDAYYGLVCDGYFKTDDEAKDTPQLFDNELKAGDLKYQDLNGDNVIDNNDMKCIGNTSPRLIYGININLAYKGFELTVLSDGRTGFDIVKSNRYYQNGWGNNNYSEYLMNSIDQGNYPRLTYYKVENNYKASTYWLEKGNYFKIQNIEFAYNLNLKNNSLWNANHMRFFLRGANLATISGIDGLDPESINAGIDRYPLNRTFTMGMKVNF